MYYQRRRREPTGPHAGLELAITIFVLVVLVAVLVVFLFVYHDVPLRTS